jgi:hypothetical protein
VGAEKSTRKFVNADTVTKVLVFNSTREPGMRRGCCRNSFEDTTSMTNGDVFIQRQLFRLLTDVSYAKFGVALTDLRCARRPRWPGGRSANRTRRSCR